MKHYICQDPPSEFEELNADQKRILLNWCDLITPIQSFNQKHTSYGLKHIFSNSLDGFYITNGQFKGAMLKLGFKVKRRHAIKLDIQCIRTLNKMVSKRKLNQL